LEILMVSHSDSFICPNWPAPPSVRAYVSTRLGGVSGVPFNELNLGAHVGDDMNHVTENRRLFADAIGMPPSVQWLNQIHGTDVVCLPCRDLPGSGDAAVTEQEDQVCAVLTADCLPVFFCDKAGTKVAVAHAGWRGLCAGILESTLEQFDEPENVLVWLGPAIGPNAFEVGDDLREAFIAEQQEAQLAFVATEKGKWLGDLYLLARQRLMVKGVVDISGGEYCTLTDKDRFYSYRRDGKTGRMASVIWLEG
jgi:polyphenol oxidase